MVSNKKTGREIYKKRYCLLVLCSNYDIQTQMSLYFILSFIKLMEVGVVGMIGRRVRKLVDGAPNRKHENVTNRNRKELETNVSVVERKQSSAANNLFVVTYYPKNFIPWI